MEAKKFINTAEVKARYGFNSSVTLHNWRKKRNFPEPLNGRYYSLAQIKQWEQNQNQL